MSFRAVSRWRDENWEFENKQAHFGMHRGSSTGVSECEVCPRSPRELPERWMDMGFVCPEIGNIASLHARLHETGSSLIDIL